MMRFSRLRIVIAFAPVALTALFVARPALAESMGLDVWNQSSLEEQLREANYIKEELRARGEATTFRLNRRADLVNDYLARNMTFGEALRLSQELNTRWPEVSEQLRFSYPAESLALSEAMHFRRLCRQRLKETTGQQLIDDCKIEADYARFLNLED